MSCSVIITAAACAAVVQRLCSACAAAVVNSRVVCGSPCRVVMLWPYNAIQQVSPSPHMRMHALQPTQKAMQSENMSASRVYVGRGCTSLLPAASSNALLLPWQRATVFTHTAYTAVKPDHVVPL